jgi:hypothetical protein
VYLLTFAQEGRLWNAIRQTGPRGDHRIHARLGQGLPDPGRGAFFSRDCPQRGSLPERSTCAKASRQCRAESGEERARAHARTFRFTRALGPSAGWIRVTHLVHPPEKSSSCGVSVVAARLWWPCPLVHVPFCGWPARYCRVPFTLKRGSCLLCRLRAFGACFRGGMGWSGVGAKSRLVGFRNFCEMGIAGGSRKRPCP